MLSSAIRRSQVNKFVTVGFTTQPKENSCLKYSALVQLPGDREAKKMASNKSLTF